MFMQQMGAFPLGFSYIFIHLNIYQTNPEEPEKPKSKSGMMTKSNVFAQKEFLETFSKRWSCEASL